MKLKNQSVCLSFFAKFLLLLMLLQIPFSGQVLCIESDGHTAIETVQFGRCDVFTESKTPQNILTSQSCEIAHGHPQSCQNCTDIPLDQEISLSRSDSEQASLKILSPSYFNLYAGEFKPYILVPAAQNITLTSEDINFVFHPHQILESTILII